MPLPILARLPGYAVVLAADADGRLLAGLADGSVWELTTKTAQVVLAATGNAVIAVARRDRDGVIAVDEAGGIRTAWGTDVVTTAIPLVVDGPAARYHGERTPPRLTCAGVAPRAPLIVASIDYGGAYRSDRLVLFDLGKLAIVADLETLTGRGDDCVVIDRVAFAGDGTRVAASGLGIRYSSEGDWLSGQDCRVIVYTLPDGQCRLTADVAQTWRPSDYQPIPLVVVGERVVAGNYVVDASDAAMTRPRVASDGARDDPRYRYHEDPPWCGSEIGELVSGGGTRIVGCDRSGWLWVRDLDDADEPSVDVELGSATAIEALAAAPDGAEIYVGFVDGTVQMWRPLRDAG